MSGKRDNLKVTAIVSVRMSIELTQPWDATGAAAGYGQSGAGSTGSVVVEPAKNIPDGGFYGDPADALKAK